MKPIKENFFTAQVCKKIDNTRSFAQTSGMEQQKFTEKLGELRARIQNSSPEVKAEIGGITALQANADGTFSDAEPHCYGWNDDFTQFSQYR